MVVHAFQQVKNRISITSGRLSSCAGKIALAMMLCQAFAWSQGKVSGNLKMWQPVIIDFEGPDSKEMGTSPNPFLDFRLTVAMKGPHGRTYQVPGFYDGDGQGGGDGKVWRVRFSPDISGNWEYTASFVSGAGIAVTNDAGTPSTFNGAKGTFTVGPRDNAAPGYWRVGWLEYAGKRYLKYRDGSYFLKGGTDDPENLLSYDGFDNTKAGAFGLLDYKSHAADWKTGDPDWGNGKGKAFIGMLNYLSEQKVNSIYFLTMNIGGDGQDTHPWASENIVRGGSSQNDNLHYDISKLTQWNIAFEHAQKKGIHLHFVLNEAEKNNKMELDNSELGVERKLFYREHVARFGYHNSLQWNLSEEYDLDYNLTPARVKSFAAYIKSIDPYKRPLTVHNWGGLPESWNPFFGDVNFDLMSIQWHPGGNDSYGALVERMHKQAETAGRPIAVALDEFDRLGKADGMNRLGSWPFTSGWSRLRKALLWPAFFGNGQVEYITVDLLDLNDFRPYEPMWKLTWYARKFMEENLPFWEMLPADELVTGEDPAINGAQVLALKGKIYAVYFPNAATTGNLDLSGAPGSYSAKWFNPRTGEFVGSELSFEGGKQVALPAAPSEASEDWTLWVKNKDYTLPVGIRDGGYKARFHKQSNRHISHSWAQKGMKLRMKGSDIQVRRPDGKTVLK